MNWLTGWRYRLKITLDKTKIDSTLTWFPVGLVPVSGLAGQGDDDVSLLFRRLAGNYLKICAAKADGVTPVYAEVVSWDHVAMDAEIWLSRDGWQLENAADPYFYLYYDPEQDDNTSWVGVTGSAPGEAVFDSDFKLVDHLNDNPDTSHTMDSTDNDNDGIKKGANEPVEAPGEVGKGQDADGSNDYIYYLDDADYRFGLTDFTVSMIIKPEQYRDETCWVFHSSVGGTTGWRIISDTANIGFYLIKVAEYLAGYFPVSLMPVGSFYRLDFVIDRAANTIQSYLNGAPVGTTVHSAGFDAADDISVASNLWLARRRVDAGGFYYADGIFDEFRVSAGKRSAAWIKAASYNASDQLIKSVEFEEFKEDNIAGVIEVTGIGIGWALTQDLITSQYVKTIGDGVTVSEVLTALLAYQVTSSITLGGVSAWLDKVIAIDTDNIPLESRNIWEACKLVRDIAGGYIYVDFDPADPSSRRLWLAASLGRHEGQQIRLGKNLIGIEHITDYLQCCNCLRPIGDGVDIEKASTRIDPVITTDASYAYITLEEEYAAYKDWTGEGDALPANVTVEKPTGDWDSPTGHDDCGYWQNPANAYDDNLATYARWMPFAYGDAYKTDWLQMTLPAMDATQVMFPSWWTSGLFPGTRYPSYIEIEIYYGGDWHQVYASSPLRDTQGEFVIASFSQQNITGLRIRYTNTADTYSWWTKVDVKEIYVWNTTGFDDDSAKWEQGAGENVVRCAIGDYTAGIGYVISYTHAPYFIDLDDLGTPPERRNIISRFQTFDTDDQDFLMSLGRAALAEYPKVTAPSTSLDVRTVDLSGEEGMEFEELELGSILRAIDEGLDIDEYAEVVRILRQDLTRPDRVTIELGSAVRDITDEI